MLVLNLCVCVCECGKLIKSPALSRAASRRGCSVRCATPICFRTSWPSHTHTQRKYICVYVCVRKPEQTKRGVHPENANVSNNKADGQTFCVGRVRERAKRVATGRAQWRRVTRALCSRCDLHFARDECRKHVNINNIKSKLN